MKWAELREGLLQLPDGEQKGAFRPLLEGVRGLTGYIFWENLFPEADGDTLVAVYLFKRVADDFFFNFGQDAQFSLDRELESGVTVERKVGQAMVPLVRYIKGVLAGRPPEECFSSLSQAAANFLQLVDEVSRRGRAFMLKEGNGNGYGKPQT